MFDTNIQNNVTLQRIKFDVGDSKVTMYSDKPWLGCYITYSHNVGEDDKVTLRMVRKPMVTYEKDDNPYFPDTIDTTLLFEGYTHKYDFMLGTETITLHSDTELKFEIANYNLNETVVTFAPL